MRDVNGWVVGAVGAAALVGAFYLGGRVTASPALSPSAATRRRGHGADIRAASSSPARPGSAS